MSSSNLTSRRITVRSRSAISSREELSSKPNSAASSASNGGGGVAALRKRSALGDMTNAGTRKPLSGTSEGGVMSSKDIESSGMTTKGKLALRDSNGTAAFVRSKATSTGADKVSSTTAKASRLVKPTSQLLQRTAATTEDAQERQSRVARRAASAIPLRTKSASTASNATFSRSNSVQSDVSRRTASSRDEQAAAAAAVQQRGVKRVKTDVGERRVVTSTKEHADNVAGLVHKKTTSSTAKIVESVQEVAAPVRAKDEGWEDLDAEDIDDPLMVAEYVNEIFEYMREIELEYMPNGDYIDKHPEITWEMRGVLVDWLIDVHSKFRLVPETLFLAQNIVDRFLSQRTISINKLQLVGLTAMFVAAKYEEVLCPSVHNFLYLAENGYTDEEILKAERYMLKVISFNLSYASPMNFLRRISKADNYDIQTRTVAKFFMEISLVDHRLLEHPPSLIAAAAVWNSRLVLERGDWTPTLVHYSGYAVEELLATAELMIDYCVRPVQHPLFIKKYSAKKFMKAATYVFDWAKKTFADVDTHDDGADEEPTALRVDLFAQYGYERPSPRRDSSERASTDEELHSPATHARHGRTNADDDGLDSAAEDEEEQADEEDDNRSERETSQDARLLTDVTNLDAAIRARKH